MPLKEFSKGEKVYVKPRPTNRQQPWIFGEVIGKPAPRACLVNTPMGPVRRNHAQIREAKVEPPDSCDRFETASIPSESGPTEQMDQSTPTTLMESEGAPLAESTAPDVQQENADFLQGLKTMLCKEQYSKEMLSYRTGPLLFVSYLQCFAVPNLATLPAEQVGSEQ